MSTNGEPSTAQPTEEEAGRFLAGDPMAPPGAAPKPAQRPRAFPTPPPGPSGPTALIITAVLGVLFITGVGIAVGTWLGLIDPPL